jgi:LCP family protein required for cell wall assembly
MNILLMGSDTRSGANGSVGAGSTADSSGYGNSDTEMIMHIAGDRKSAEVMSLPRDLVTTIPACKTASGGTEQQHLGQINSAYAEGGPACAMKTVEAMTNIRMDHTVVVDFAGFEHIVSDIGGVPICLPKAINDPIGHIYMKAGQYTVKGKQALNFVRERHALGDGGDRSRITRQHAFISSMIKKVESSGTLSNPSTLLSLANDATKSLTVDKPLASVSSLLGLANQLKGIKMQNIKFFTVANQDYPVGAPMYQTYKQQLALIPAQAEEEFAAFRGDAPLPGTAPSPSASSSSPAQKPSGAGIRVAVYNGTSHRGLALTATKTLQQHQFTATTEYTSPGQNYTTTLIEYGPGQEAHARTLAAYFSGARLQSTTTTTGIKLIVGSDYLAAGGGAAPKPTVVPSAIATARSADTNICHGVTEGDS